MKKISVVVPVYNVEKTLERCAASLFSQDFPDKEIILVDDGSADGSGRLCDSYAVRPEVRVFHQENAGLGPARNRGLAAAAGEYVLFADSDDYLGPGLLRRLYAAAKEADADIAVSGFTMVSRDGRERPVPYEAQARLFAGEELRGLRLNTVGALPEEPLDSKYGMSACARLYRRSLVEAAGLRFVSERRLISEDLIFNLEFLKRAQRAVVTPDTAYFYCNNGESLSKRRRADRFEQDCALYRAVEALLAPDFAREEYAPYLQRMLISRARFDMAQEAAYFGRTGGRRLRESVRAIARHPLLRDALAHYPWQRLPRMQAVFTAAMKWGSPALLIGLIRARQRWLPENG